MAKKSVNCLVFFANVLPLHHALSVHLTCCILYLLKSLIRTTTSNKRNKERTKYTLELHPLVQASHSVFKVVVDLDESMVGLHFSFVLKVVLDSPRNEDIIINFNTL